MDSKAVVSLTLTMLGLLVTLSVQAQSFDLPNRKAQLGEVHYSALVGCTVGAEGKRFQAIVVPESGRLKAIRVCTDNGSIVQALEFVSTDTIGQKSKQIIGNPRGKWSEPYVIPAGRTLVGIAGAGGWWIDRLRFILDDGSESPTYGGNGGDTEFRLVLAQRDEQWKGRLMGFWETAGEQLEALGLIFWPIE